MSNTRTLTIAQKLRNMILVVTGGALLISSVIYLAIEFYSYRQSLIERAEVLAHFISTNSTAALSFGDRKTANRLLSSLRSEPSVDYAAMYLSDGELFAEYTRGAVAASRFRAAVGKWMDSLLPDQLEKTAYRVHGNHIGT